MPSQNEIYNYWVDGGGSKLMREHGIELGDLACFACGFDLKIERAHIVAVTAGGTNSEDNLHLLCPNCHIESENFRLDFYWLWLKNKNSRSYRTSFEQSDDRLKLLDRDFNDFMTLIKDEKFYEAAIWFKKPYFDHDDEESIDELAIEFERKYRNCVKLNE